MTVKASHSVYKKYVSFVLALFLLFTFAAQRREQPLARMRPLFILEFIYQLLSEEPMGRRNSETACRLDSGRNGAAPTIGIDLSGATLCGYYAWCYLYFPGSVGTTAPDDSHKWKARDMSHWCFVFVVSSPVRGDETVGVPGVLESSFKLLQGPG
uniref:Secreted protein n=1 Tax=Ascaris lumbricoides TaxID=6252 RepID=A0A0M3IBL4_ASCLU